MKGPSFVAIVEGRHLGLVQRDEGLMDPADEHLVEEAREDLAIGAVEPHATRGLATKPRRRPP
jgi:hypothetical protein